MGPAGLTAQQEKIQLKHCDFWLFRFLTTKPITYKNLPLFLKGIIILKYFDSLIINC